MRVYNSIWRFYCLCLPLLCLSLPQNPHSVKMALVTTSVPIFRNMSIHRLATIINAVLHLSFSHSLCQYSQTGSMFLDMYTFWFTQYTSPPPSQLSSSRSTSFLYLPSPGRSSRLNATRNHPMTGSEHMMIQIKYPCKNWERTPRAKSDVNSAGAKARVADVRERAIAFCGE